MAALAPARPGRNDPCSCGSGRKYKKCCGSTTASPAAAGPDADALARAALDRLSAGDPVAADMLARDALLRDAAHPDALNVLAIVACRSRQFADSLRYIDRALERQPRSAQLIMNRGNILRESGDAPGAIEALQRALALEPDLLAAQFNLGLALVEAGHDEAAADAFVRSIDGPVDADTLTDLADQLRGIHRYDAMVVVLQRALTHVSGEDHRLLNDLGMGLLELGRPDLAEAPLRRAVAVRPDVALLHRNLGTVMLEQGRVADAIAHANEALARDSSRHETQCLLGAAYGALHDADAADRHFRAARAIAPDDALTDLRHGMLLLAAGDYATGLPMLERRLDDSRILPWQRLARMPRWRGEPVDGKTVLVHAEQGHGDALQFVRYVPLLAARGARVRVVAHAGLQRLFTSVDGITTLHVLGAPLPDADFHVPMMSLPLGFGTTRDDIPAAVPYLHAPEGAHSKWAALLHGAPGRRVGLVWSGNPEYGTDRRRSLGAALLEPLADVAGVSWISLQKTPPGYPLVAAPSALRMHDWTGELTDFADTAGLVAQLDLVVSVDTSVAHLAGALGKPVWLLNRFDTDWRWGWTASTTPWYPTMRIFRQTTPGDWRGVIDAVRAALDDTVDVRGTPRG